MLTYIGTDRRFRAPHLRPQKIMLQVYKISWKDISNKIKTMTPRGHILDYKACELTLFRLLRLPVSCSGLQTHIKTHIK